MGAAPVRARLRALGAVEALTDWLLAGRALLADPATGYERMAERLAAICARARGPRRRSRGACATGDRARARRRGRLVRPDAGVEEHVEELGANLRAILRDVLCGHLDPALRTLADGILASDEQPAEPTAF